MATEDRPSKHICLTQRHAMMISDEPEYDIIVADVHAHSEFLAVGGIVTDVVLNVLFSASVFDLFDKVDDVVR